jgi:hypothetical protein
VVVVLQADNQEIFFKIYHEISETDSRHGKPDDIPQTVDASVVWLLSSYHIAELTASIFLNSKSIPYVT